MQINYFTLFWLGVALISMFGLYFFNSGRSFLTFVTAKKYLLLFLVAALLGMRQKYEGALLLSGIALFVMWLDYKPYVEMCQRLKNYQGRKH